MSSTCGIMHGDGLGAPVDTEGCRLPYGHDGPHEYVTRRGDAYQWETDWECTCENCMSIDPDFCTIYWKKD